MKSSELKKVLRKGDIIVFLSLIVITVIWFLVPLFSSGERTVRIYTDGEIYGEYILSALDGEEMVSLNGCQIKISADGAEFISSDCPDGLCVKRGLLHNIGDVMACVPKGITVEIRGSESKIDGISY